MWFVEERMMPGQSPYTPEERAAVQKLVDGANDAQEMFDEDELEEYARKQEEQS